MTIPIKVQKSDNDIEDPVERMLKKTGCMELHYQVQVTAYYHRFLHQPISNCSKIILNTKFFYTEFLSASPSWVDKRRDRFS